MKLIDDPNFLMRYLDERDGPTLKKWLSDPEIQKYFACRTEKEIDLMVRIWMGYSRYKCGLTAEYEGKRCGMGILFLMPYRKVAHHCMAYLAVPPEFQKKGIGTSLTTNLINLGKNYFRQERIHFEVFGSSPLLKILEREECALVAKQDDYIAFEDGFAPRTIMEKIFI